MIKQNYLRILGGQLRLYKPSRVAFLVLTSITEAPSPGLVSPPAMLSVEGSQVAVFNCAENVG